MPLFSLLYAYPRRLALCLLLPFPSSHFFRAVVGWDPSATHLSKENPLGNGCCSPFASYSSFAASELKHPASRKGRDARSHKCPLSQPFCQRLDRQTTSLLTHCTQALPQAAFIPHTLSTQGQLVVLGNLAMVAGSYEGTVSPRSR